MHLSPIYDRLWQRLSASICGCVLLLPVGGGAQVSPQPAAAPQSTAQITTQSPASPADLDAYIRSGWDRLSRLTADCRSVVDLKVTSAPVLYLPAGMAPPPAVRALRAGCHVRIEHLPRPIRAIGDVRPAELKTEGLLYLPNRYVVPGGRFNEMYGWDSYFILLGLLRDGRDDLARGAVENFFFEIENYGALLNANRTYFLTRSQPPLLSSMIREVYEHSGSGPRGTAPLSKPWLAHAYAMAERDHALWVSPLHTLGTTGLSRYHDLGTGPVPEMADDSTYYPDVIRWLLAHPGQHLAQAQSEHPDQGRGSLDSPGSLNSLSSLDLPDSLGYLVAGPAEPTAAQAAELAEVSCDVRTSKVCAHAVVDGQRLSADFYAGDRAMRESGFDTTFRFGPFSGSTEQYAPVCLNSLLFKYETDLAHFATLLGRTAEARGWTAMAEARRAAVNKYLWNASDGYFYDWNDTTGKQSTYRYITGFYPLWSGLATSAQAAAVEAHLPEYERAGGLATSTFVSGTQWDAPFGWAPTNWLAVAGLERYGFHEDARRIAREFRSTVLGNFRRDGTVREKYNVVSGSANIAVAAGYKSNVIGFGWTNGVYLRMGDLLAGAEESDQPSPR